MAITSDAFVVGDRYVVGEVLGRGGMGEVRRARDLRLDRDVALKFLRTDLAAQSDARERFKQEAQNAARLTHPNVVLVLDSGVFAEQPYLVMECLPGETLHDQLRSGPLSEDRACDVARDVLAALTAAHQLGIVHRDVSPANILFTNDGRAKLADFGIAKAAESTNNTLAGQVLGTPSYLSPERVRGEAATPASDVYALGVTLYEALSGQRPFTGETPVAIAHSVLSTTPPSLQSLRPDVDPTLALLVSRAMEPDPALRPSAAALLEELEAPDESTAMITAAIIPETAASTVAMAAVRAPGPGTAPFRLRRPQLITIAMVVLAGVLLLLLTQAGTGSGDSPSTADTPEVTAQVTTPPTTAAPPPSTTAVVRIQIGGDGNDNDGDKRRARKGGKKRD